MRQLKKSSNFIRNLLPAIKAKIIKKAKQQFFNVFLVS